MPKIIATVVIVIGRGPSIGGWRRSVPHPYSPAPDPSTRDLEIAMTEATAPWVTATTGAATYRTEISAAGHTVVSDEPAGAGGANDGPSPYDLLLGAISSCTAMTLRMYAARKEWPLEEVVVRVRNERRHAADCADCDTKRVGISRIEREIELKGALTDDQRRRLLAIADRCPVKQTLERGMEVVEAS